MRQATMIILATAALMGLVVGVTIAWQEGALPTAITGGPKVVGAIPWTLTSVSEDARTLTIYHEDPRCGEHDGTPTVVERPGSVEITVPRVQTEFGEIDCSLELRLGTTPVRLSAPLGRRALMQPDDKNAVDYGLDQLVSNRPDAKDCRRLAAYPSGAPAREVPWVARRLRLCSRATLRP